MCNIMLAMFSLFPKLFTEMILSGYDKTKNTRTDLCGLPLYIKDYSYISPYVSLIDIDLLKEHESFIVGTSNTLIMRENPIKADAIVMDGRVKFFDKQLEKSLRLTTSDKIFMDQVVGAVRSYEERDIKPYVGSDDWVREYFEIYTCSLMAAVLEQEEGDETASFSICEPYNQLFIDEWKLTYNYQCWLDQVDSMHVRSEISPLHPGGNEKRLFEDISSAVGDKINTIGSDLSSTLGGFKDTVSNIFNKQTKEPTIVINEEREISESSTEHQSQEKPDENLADSIANKLMSLFKKKQ
eukprot:TRINITY_DN3787_c0_g1_i1.p1 TRINITY_DN3787_c0_g1~~TRINITY_DN3787_c0_g1_i1.p1  ORF type:complete len:297 (-),score=54.14 TRINITY_DN3787_c0_g1_i1:42-932(-)